MKRLVELAETFPYLFLREGVKMQLKILYLILYSDTYPTIIFSVFVSLRCYPPSKNWQMN